jgi:hypothetical protein
VVRAGERDLEVLSQVIADAFRDLAVSQWLIPDPDARRAIFPGYFQILLQHALDIGLVYTTEQRTAAALWLPAAGSASPPGGYAGQLAEATGPYLNRFLPSTRNSPAATRQDCHIITWPSSPSVPTGRGRASAPGCWTPTTPSSTLRASSPTWRHPTSGTWPVPASRLHRSRAAHSAAGRPGDAPHDARAATGSVAR